MKNKESVFGIRPIIELIKSGKTIDKLFIQKGLHNESLAILWKLVRENRINYKHVPAEKMNRLTKKNHQGVFAFISPIDFYNIDDVIPNLYEEGKSPLILVLDRITDVRNFGAIARTAECSNVDCIIVPEQNSAAINSDAMKTSSGALNNIKICRTWNLEMTLQMIKDSGIQIVSCTEKTNNKIMEFTYQNSNTQKIVLKRDLEKDNFNDEILSISLEKEIIYKENLILQSWRYLEHQGL